MSKYKKGEALPLEYGLYNTFNPIAGPFLHEKLGLTPNMITLLSILSGLTSAYNLYKGRFTSSAILLVLAQTLDGIDGYVARKYNMTSKFGDRLDHYSDIIVFSLIFCLILKRLWKKSKYFTYLFIVTSSLLTILLKKRHDCVMRDAKECKNENERTLILKHTKILSYFEIVCMIALLIFSFRYYK